MKQIKKTNERRFSSEGTGQLGKSGTRPYETPSMSVVMTVSVSPILAASIVQNSKIESVGQQVGFTYKLNSADGIDSNTGKTFSHEWETDKDE